MRKGVSLFQKIGVGCFFYIVALVVFFFTYDYYLLFNFFYIGTVTIIGLLLYFSLEKEKKEIARIFVQFGIGMYMVILVAIVWRENIQIESFLINLLMILGGDVMVITSASIMHYLVAKTIGVIAIGRNWCGWACWFPAIFDLLPFKQSKRRIGKLEKIKYFTFIISILISVWILTSDNRINFYYKHVVSFICVSLAIYYIIGIILIVVLKDNRALCKYFCPVPVLQKLFMPLSIFYIKVEPEKCVGCKSCERSCGMDIEITKYVDEKRNVTSKDCIQCRKCVEHCHFDVLSVGMGLKKGKTVEHIRYQESNFNREGVIDIKTNIMEEQNELYRS